MSKNPVIAIYPKLGQTLDRLVNPVSQFTGAKLDEAMLADDIVVFKRTSTDMLRPSGVTHNYHHRHELVIPLQKKGRIHVDGVSYLLEPGQIYLIFPHQFHHYLDIEKGEIKWLFMNFDHKSKTTLKPLRNSPRALGIEEVEGLESMLNEYVSLPPGPERSFELVFRVSYLLRRLLTCRVADCVVRSETGEQDSRGAILQSINSYVRSHLDQSLTIADLAKYTGYSISYLRATFRKELGVSLGGYMRDSRLSIAASMLSKPDRESVETIAKACGFDSIYSFSRAFKNAMGFSPSGYCKFVQAPDAGR